MRTRGLGAVVALALVAASPGCVADSAAARERRVALDPGATAREIIEAGTAAGVGVSGDRTLVTYRVSAGDGGEQFQVAWRLYDASGDRVAEGKLTDQGSEAAVLTAGTGFVVPGRQGPVLVGAEGRATRLRLDAGTPSPTRPGDVLLTDVLPPLEVGRATYVLRPSVGRAAPTVHRLTLPGGTVQDVAVDADGRVWAHVVRDRSGGAPPSSAIVWSADGRSPWHSERVPLRRGEHVLSGLVVADGRLLLFTSRSGTAESAPLAGLWQRPAEPGGAWRRTDLAGLALGRTLEPGVWALPDGRLVLADDEEPFYVQGGDGFRPVRVPGVYTVDLDVVGADLYLARGPRHDLVVTHDEGRTWEPLPR